MKQNFFEYYSSKTEAVLVGNSHQVQSSSITSITISGHDRPQLTFEAHIKNLCRFSLYHLRNIAKLCFTTADAENPLCLLNTQLLYRTARQDP